MRKYDRWVSRAVLCYLLFIFFGIFSPGLFADMRFLSVTLEEGERYGISRRDGFYYASAGSSSWSKRSKGLPKRIIYPFTGEEGWRELTSLGVDNENGKRLLVSNPYGLYYSENRGSSWISVPLADPLKPVAYITSVALKGGMPGKEFSEGTLLVGTSFSGLYQSIDGGNTWLKLNELLDDFYVGAGFYEEISGLAFHPDDEGTLFLSKGFGGGLYYLNLVRDTLKEISYPGKEKKQNIVHIMAESSNPLVLKVTTDEGLLWRGEKAPDDNWTWTSGPLSMELPEGLSPENTHTAEGAKEQYGMYVSPSKAAGDALDSHILFAKEHGFNSMVVDMKDDRGRLTYDTSLELPKKIGGVWSRFYLDKLIEKAHRENISVIGRIVVFQDPVLYTYDSNAYAIWDEEEDGPWGYKAKVLTDETEETTYEQREFWVDPYSEFVWSYNIAIAKELEARGLDEIQFDYIRFPSDGDVWNGTHRYKKPGMTKMEALESFLAMAGKKIDIPISADLYGFNSYYRMGNWIGQNVEVFSHYVDAVCPMFYPSHFPRSFLKETAYLPRAEEIYKEGTSRARTIVEPGCVVRPFIQAFLIGGELKFEKPVYTDYLIRQLKGSLHGGASGFTLWNASNRYYMVTRSLKEYTSKKKEGVGLSSRN